MVAVFTGNGLGLFDTSFGATGGGLSGATARDRQGVNVASGNLVLQGLDELLNYRGMNLGSYHTYNSAGAASAGPDGWLGMESSLTVTGTYETAGSKVIHKMADGSTVEYLWNATRSLYESTAGDGAHDVFYWSASLSQFIREDGNSLRREYYEARPDLATEFRLQHVRETRHDSGDMARMVYVYDPNVHTRILEIRSYRTGDYETTNDAIVFTYNAAGQVASVSTRENGVMKLQTTYAYDTLGRLEYVYHDLTVGTTSDNAWNGTTASANDGRLYRTQYVYDGTSMRIAAVIGSDGQRTDYTYDASGRIRTVARPGGDTLTFTYNAGSTDVVDALSRKWTYFHSGGRLTAVHGPARDGLRDVTDYTYNTAGDVTSVQTSRGGVVLARREFTYDTRGNVLWEVDAEGNSIQRTWTWLNQLSTVRTYTVADPDGLAGPAAPSGERLTRYVYNTDGRLLRFIIEPNGNVTEMVYGTTAGAGDLGQLTETRRYVATAYTGATDYASLETWSQTQAATGTLTTYEYDLLGRMSARNEYASLNADGTGKVDAGMSRTTFVYDAQGLLLTQRTLHGAGHPAGAGASASTEVVDYIYDGLGRLLDVVRHDGGTTYVRGVTNIDTLNYGDAIATTAAQAAADLATDVTRTRYLDSAMSVTTVTDAGVTRTELRDGAGRLVSVAEAAPTLATRTAYNYYDAAGQLRVEEDFSGARTYHFYDERGNRVLTVDPTGNVAENIVDSLGRVVRTIRYARALSISGISAWLTGTGPTAVLAMPAITGARPADWVEAFTDSTLTTSLDGTQIDGTYDGGFRVENGRLVVQRAEYASSVWPRIVTTATQAITVGLQYSAEVSTAASMTSMYMLMSLQNGAAGADLRRGAVYFSNGKLYHHANIAGVQTNTLLGNLAANTTYVVEMFAGEGGLEFYVYAKGQDRANGFFYRQAIDTAEWGQVQMQINGYMGPGQAGDPVYVDNLYYRRVRQTTNDYDLAGRLVETSDGASTTRFEYDGAGRLVRTTVSTPGELDRVTRQFYDADDNLIATLDAEGGFTAYTYDAGDRLVRTTRYGNSVTASLWANGTRDQIVADFTARFPSGHASDQYTRVFYDARDRAVAELDAEGYLTVTTYDEADHDVATRRYAKQLAPGGTKTLATLLSEATTSAPAEAYQETRRAFDHLGRLSIEVNHENTVTKYWYDHANRVTRIEAAQGTGEVRNASQLFDAFGNLVGEIDPTVAMNGATPRLLDTMTYAQKLAVIDTYGTRHEYDAMGRRIESIDRLDNRTWYFHDVAGRVRHVLRGLAGNTRAEVIETRYNAFGDISETLTYTGTLPIGGTRTRADAQTALTTLAFNATVDTRRLFFYDSRGLLLQQVNPVSGATLMRYNGFGELVSTTVPTTVPGSGVQSSSTTTRTYDRRGFVVSETQGDGSAVERTLTRQYDVFGRVVTSRDGRGFDTVAKYDRLGRQLSVERQIYTGITGAQRVERATTTYDAFSRVLTQVNALGQTTTYVYSDTGRSVTVTTPDGLVTRSERNRHGDTLEITAPGGGVTTYTYDLAGRVKTVTDPLGNVTTSEYDVLGRLGATVDDAGTRIEYTYDAVGRVLTRKEDAGSSRLNLTTTWTYDGQGRVITMVDPTGRTTTTKYDVEGRTTEVARDPAGLNLITRFTWDAAGRQVKAAEYAGTDLLRTTVYTYDALGRRTSETIDDGGLDLTTSYVYDANDNVVARIDANGVAHYFAYDQADRLIYSMDTLSGAGDTTPTVAVTRHWYDEAGRSVATRRYFTTLTLTSAQALDLQTATGGTSLATLDTLTNGIELDDKDAVEYRVFDPAGKLKAVITQTGSTSAYLREIRYDSRGNGNYELSYTAARSLTATDQAYFLMQGEIAASGTGSAYDRQVRAQALINQSTAAHHRYGVFDEAGNERYVVVLNDAGTAGYVVERQYDEAGRLIAEIRHAKTVAPNAGATVANMQSQLGTATADQMLVTRYVHDRVGRLRYTIDDAGFVVQQTYDGAGRVTQIHQFTDPIAPASWTEAAVAAALTDKDSVRLALNEYDTADRLKKTTDALGHSETMVYDDVANTQTRTDRTGNATVSTYDDAGRLVSVRNALGHVESYSYDGLGRRTKVTDATSKVTTFDYDALGNLTKTTDPLGWYETFTYDALGNRTSYTDKTRLATWNYEYDQLGRMTKELSPTVTVHRYSAASGTALLPESKRIETTMVYDAFGNVISRTENAAGPVAERRTTTYGYDTRGNQTLTTFPRAWEIDSTTLVLADTLAATTIEVTYDAFGRAVVQKDTRGNYTYKVYDQLDRVLHEIDAEGYVTSYEYDPEGRQTKLTRRAAKLAENVPAGRGSGALISDASFASAIAALSTTGNRVVVTSYDAAGRKTQVQTTGANIEYYTSAGTLSSGTPTTKFEYDDAGRLVKERVLLEVTGTTEVYAETWHWYDDAGNRTHTVDPENYLTKWTYDAAGRETTRTEFANAFTGTKTTATPPANPAAGTAATGFDRTVTTTYDAAGRKATETVFRRYQTAAGVDASGNLVTTFEYDKEGRVIKTTVDDPTAAAPAVTTTAYDALGRQTSVTEHARQVLKTSWQTDLQLLENDLDTTALYESITPYTRMDYDAFGNVVRIYKPGRGINGTTVQSTADDQTTCTRYDYQGRAVVTIDAEGVATYSHYNAADQATRVFYDLANGYGGVTRVVELLTYDRLGRQVENYLCHRVGVTDTAQRANAVAYNAFGEIVTKAWTYGDLADATKVKTLDYKYNAAGQLTDSDESGVNRRYRYNLAGQQVAELRDPTSTAQTRHVLDKLGRATRTYLPAFDAGGTITSIVRTYDRWGNVLTETDPRGGLTTRTYSDTNQVLTQLAPSVAVMGANNLVTTYRPETRWWYDANGRVIGVRDAAGNVDKNEYDSAGQLIRTTNALGYSTRFAYDALGRNRVQMDALGYHTSQNYDRLNRVTGTGDFRIDTTTGKRVAHVRETYVLNRNGDRIKVKNALNQEQLFNFDAAGALLRSQSATGAVMTYTYDWSGNKTSETYAAGTALADMQTWTYDIHSRLTDHDDLAGNDYDYTYDSAGLRSQEASTVLGLDRDTTYYANGMVRRVQLSATDYTEYEYDATGNRTLERTYKAASGAQPLVHTETRITYDSHGRIATVTNDDFARTDGGTSRVLTVSYVYDANGNRRKLTIDSAYGPGNTHEESWFTYDAENRVLVADGRMDANGVLIAANGAPGRRNTAYTNTYDELGRVVKRDEIDLYGEVTSYTTAWSDRSEELRVYKQMAADDSGGVLLRKYKGTPEIQVKNTYDAAGRLTEAVTYFEPYATARMYNETTNYPITIYLHGVVRSATQYVYDADGRLQAQITWGRRAGTNQAPPSSPYYPNNGGVPADAWVVEAFEGGAYPAAQYSWDAATNSCGLTKLEEVQYTKADGSSGYDAAGRMTTYRFMRYAPAWVHMKTPSTEDWETYTHTYTTTYLARDGYLEDLTSGTSSNSKFKTSTTDSVYDAAGRRITLLDTTVIKDAPDLEARRSFVYNADGQIVLRRAEHKDDGVWKQGRDEEGSALLLNKWSAFYPDYASWNGLGKAGREALWDRTDNLRGIYVNGQQIASVTEAGTDLDVTSRMTGFKNTELGRGMTQVSQGDTLKTIAQRIYGTEALWYVLADANGLEENSELAAGTLLSTPEVKTSTNDASTFKPYNPSEMTGPTTPNLPFIPPPDAGCGTIGMIIMVVVMIVVTIYTAGAAAALFSTAAPGMATGLAAMAGGGALMSTGVAMGAAAIGGFVGSAVGQAVGSVMGVASFSWKKALASGAAAGLTAGVSGSGIIGDIAGKSKFVQGALTSVSNSLVSQATDRAFGLETSFSWKSIAVNAVSAGITSSMSPFITKGLDSIPGVDVSKGFGKLLSDFSTGMAGGLVSAHLSRAAGLTEHINAKGIAANAFGNALANWIVDSSISRGEEKRFAALENDIQSRLDAQREDLANQGYTREQIDRIAPPTVKAYLENMQAQALASQAEVLVGDPTTVRLDGVAVSSGGTGGGGGGGSYSGVDANTGWGEAIDPYAMLAYMLPHNQIKFGAGIVTGVIGKVGDDLRSLGEAGLWLLEGVRDKMMTDAYDLRGGAIPLVVSDADYTAAQGRLAEKASMVKGVIENLPDILMSIPGNMLDDLQKDTRAFSRDFNQRNYFDSGIAGGMLLYATVGMVTGGAALIKGGVAVGRGAMTAIRQLSAAAKRVVRSADLPHVPSVPRGRTGAPAATHAEGELPIRRRIAAQRQLAPEFEVAEFRPLDGAAFKKLSPEEQQSWLREYARQVSGQEAGINELTVDEFRAARAAYREFGRNPEAEGLQRSFAKQFERGIAGRIQRDLIDSGIDGDIAKQMANARAAEIRSGLAALHEPDMVAGGYSGAAPTRMGSSSVNSAIGASWSSRLPALDAWAANAARNGYGTANMNVRLPVRGYR